LKLSDLIHLLEPTQVNGMPSAPEATPIESVHYRSQDVRPNGVFVAIPGFTADGHDFIQDAVTRGAVAVISQKQVKASCSVIQVANTRRALGILSDYQYGHPSEKLTIIGITGTNGKTTTSYLIESILETAGYSVGVIGTINYRFQGKQFKNPMTTPESLDLQKILSTMHTAGVTHVVMEISSHAIDLHRIQNCWLDVAVYTNLSQDHLDYHHTMEAYWSCKKQLFTHFLWMGPKERHAQAVINANDTWGRELLNGRKEILSTGFTRDCSIWSDSYVCNASGISGQITTQTGSFEFQSPLAGAYNMENILSATGAAAALKVPIHTIAKGLMRVHSVPGRLEQITDHSGRRLYIDYAHTPAALENTLSAVKEFTKGRIICVFGCGGDRDTDKRPKMGKIVAQGSDLAIVTSDNPRSEAPLDIIKQILPGVKKGLAVEYPPADLAGEFTEKGFVVEPDRRQAIHLAAKIARPGDSVLIAGKGHENYQIIGKQTIPFDDREEARSALEKTAMDE
jgi:UDP-N-acetylmuramyl-tripeptide synthetase